jgi:PAS domain S-box-containing protein
MFANMVSLALANIRVYQSLETKVIERTKELRSVNAELRKRAKEREKTTYSLGKANIKLLAIQEELEKKNQEMEKLLDALYENEEKFRQLTENINEVFWISDLEQGRMIYVSPSYEDLFGRKPELLYEDHDRWLEAVHPDDLPKLSDSFAGDSTLTHELEYRIIRPDGSIRWIRARGFPVRNESGMIYRYCGVSEDITKRKEAEDKLNLYHEIFINSNDAIVIMEPDGTYREQNPAYRRMNGYEDEELRGQTPALIIGESSFQMIGEHLAKEGSYRGEVIGTTKGGLQKNIELSAFSIRDDKGNNVCHVGFARDITERKRAEDARKQILKDLENANQHLRETQGQLVQSEKMASLGMLVAGIAHEINTPVGAIHSMHDTLKRAVEKLKTFMQTQSQDDFENNREISGPFKTIEDANRVINSGCERVTNIVRRLRSFARLDEAELKTANIHEGLEDTLTLIHHEIKRSITVHKEYGDIPPIPCYPGRLNQIYLNILINARQAIPDKGEIRIRTYEEGEKIHIAISDTGIGIPQDKISRIFDPGFTTKGVGVGTGLGLSIVYRIIQEHKGEIKVQSKVGEGSTFTIILPKNLDVLTKKVTH